MVFARLERIHWNRSVSLYYNNDTAIIEKEFEDFVLKNDLGRTNFKEFSSHFCNFFTWLQSKSIRWNFQDSSWWFRHISKWNWNIRSSKLVIFSNRWKRKRSNKLYLLGRNFSSTTLRMVRKFFEISSNLKNLSKIHLYYYYFFLKFFKFL